MMEIIGFLEPARVPLPATSISPVSQLSPATSQPLFSTAPSFPSPNNRFPSIPPSRGQQFQPSPHCWALDCAAFRGAAGLAGLGARGMQPGMLQGTQPLERERAPSSGGTRDPGGCWQLQTSSRGGRHFWHVSFAVWGLGTCSFPLMESVTTSIFFGGNRETELSKGAEVNSDFGADLWLAPFNNYFVSG